MDGSTRCLVFVLLALMSTSASATSTLCQFTAHDAAPVQSVELIGHSRVDAVQVETRMGPRALPTGTWRVRTFNARKAQIELVFRNPGDRSLPSSFRLKGSGSKVRLSVANHSVVGELACGS
jgi:hypothetical protein